MMICGNVDLLSMGGEIGFLECGCFVDFVVLDFKVIFVMFYCMEIIGDMIEEELFVLMIFGDDCVVCVIYV